MDFIIENWPWLLAIVVFFVMAIIEYYAEKTGYTKKIKFKKEKEKVLPTELMSNDDPLQNVEEVEEQPVIENAVETEFMESLSAEKITEKLLNQAAGEDRLPDVRDIEEEIPVGDENYEYIEVDDENVNVLFEVVDQNGDFDPNAAQTLRVTNGDESYISSEDANKVATLIEEYDDKIKTHVETKKIFGDETGYLDKENATQLLSIIKQYEKDLKSNLADSSYTDELLAKIINLSSNITAARTVNSAVATDIIETLEQYEDTITPSIENPRDLARLMNNIESYKKYIDSKTIASTDDSVFNLLELYAKNIGANLTKDDESAQDNANKLLGIIRQYENVIKPALKEPEESTELLNRIIEESSLITSEAVTEEAANSLIELLNEYEAALVDKIEDKKELKKFNTSINEFKEYIVSKRDENKPVEETATEEGINFEFPTETAPSTDVSPAIYNLIEDYNEKIKPNIETKKIFGGSTGYIDKKSAESMLNIINEYTNNIKPELGDNVEGERILSALLDYSSNVVSASITDVQISKILDLLEEYGRFIVENIKNANKLNEVLLMVEDYKDYISNMKTAENVISLTPERTGALINLLDQYEQYIKPFILSRRIFGENTGYIDKKYANNMLELITDYEKNVKNVVGNSTNMENMLSNLIDHGSKIDSNTMTNEEADTILELLDNYEEEASKNITDTDVLAKVTKTIEKNRKHIRAMVGAPEFSLDLHKPVFNVELDSLNEESKVDMILDMVKDGKETFSVDDAEFVPIIIPKTVLEEDMPVIIPSKKKTVETITSKTKKVTKSKNKAKKPKKVKVELPDNSAEILDIIKSTNVEEPVVTVAKKSKKVNEEVTTISKKKKVDDSTVTKKKTPKNKVEDVSVSKTSKNSKKTKTSEIVDINLDKSTEKEEVATVKNDVSKTNRNKKKKQNKIKRELKKIIKKEMKQEELREEENKIVPILEEKKEESVPTQDVIFPVKDNVVDTNSYDMEYDMIEADEEPFED